MDRLTTDNPKSNMESACNIFRIANKETVCNLTEDNSEITLYVLMRRCAKTLNCCVSYEDTDDSIGEFLFDHLYDGCTTPEGILAHFYTTAWAFSVSRAHLAAYEDTGLTPEEIASLKDTAIRGDGYHKKYSAALADLDAKDAEIATLKKAFALTCRILEDLQIALRVMREARGSNE